jgi:hypothetical protein
MGLLAVAWLAAVGGLFQLFHYWQGQGLRRGALLLGIGALCWGVYRWARSGRTTIALPRLAGVVLALLAAAAMANSTVQAFRTIDASRRAGDVFHDQGQIALRALRLLQQRLNPYGERTMLDPLAFSDRLRELSGRPECGSVDVGAGRRALRDFWYGSLDPVQMRSLFPDVSAAASCADLRLRFQSLGFHYGPVLLLLYLPFVTLFGPAGIYVAHLTALLAWMAGLGVYLRRTLANVPWIPAFAAIILFLLAPSHVNHIFLRLAASDLLPVILASIALLCWLRGRDLFAALFLSISVGSKLFPGLLYTPLLLRTPRAAATFAGIAAAIYLPFLLWDPRGVAHNLSFPLTLRDSTAPLFSVPSVLGSLLRAGALAGLGLWLWRLRARGWAEQASLLFVVFLHVAALGLGGMLHNNYLIWAMSVVAVFWVRLIDTPLVQKGLPIQNVP